MGPKFARVHDPSAEMRASGPTAAEAADDAEDDDLADEDLPPVSPALIAETRKWLADLHLAPRESTSHQGTAKDPLRNGVLLCDIVGLSGRNLFFFFFHFFVHSNYSHAFFLKN
jgi:hypothetical protein